MVIYGGMLLYGSESFEGLGVDFTCQAKIVTVCRLYNNSYVSYFIVGAYESTAKRGPTSIPSHKCAAASP